MSQSSEDLTKLYIPPHQRNTKVTEVTLPDALVQAKSFGRFSKRSSYRMIVRNERNERINQLNAELTSMSVLPRTTTVRFSDANLIFYVIQ